MTDDELKKVEDLARTEQEELRKKPEEEVHEIVIDNSGVTGFGSIIGGTNSWSLAAGNLIAYDSVTYTKTPNKEHDDQARCQESYDEGYQDGLKAAREESK